MNARGRTKAEARRGFRLRRRDGSTLLSWLWGLLVTLAPWPHAIEAQPASAYDEVGNFYLQSFGPEDYGWHPQNWGVVQGPNGLVYVGNGKGVLEYDGVSWRRILLANRTAGAALAVDADGRIFVGGDGLGYLAPDEHGRMQYVSLLDELPAEDRKLGTIRRAEATSDGVTFFTGDRLIRWNGREMKVWRAETAFRLIYVLDDVLYARQEGFGLMRIEGDALVMAPGGAFFRGKQIYGLLPGPDGSHLVFTRQQGVFQCSASERAAAGSRDPVCTPFNPGLTDLLIELQAYYAVALPGGLRAIGTLRGGVILLDQEGRLLRILNEASGLPSNTVYSAYVDREGGLWLSLNGGLARVEIGAPLSYWDKTSGLRGNVTDIARHEGRLYATTERGVYGLMPAEEGAAPRFLSSKALSAHCWTLLSTPQGLLAGCWSGLFNLDNQQQLWSIGSNSVFALHRSRRDPERLYLGLTDGLARMRLRDGQWTDVERIDGIDSRIYSIVEDDLGRLWVGTAADGVIRLEPGVSISDASASEDSASEDSASEDSASEDSASDEPASDAPGAGDLMITSFGAADGLPVGTTRVRQVAGRVVVLSEPERSLWRLDAEATGFVRDTSFDDVMPEGPDGIDELIEDDQGRVWIAAGAASGVAHPAPEGGYTWAPTALRRAPPTAAYSLHLDADGSLWRGGANELVRYDTRRALDRSASYPVWIRRVSAASGTTLSTASGTTLYDGRSGDLQAERPYRDNTLRFTFAAPRHDASARTEYRVRLEGRGLAARGEDWSAWTNETYKDYTELWEGRYVFSVQARDVYGYLSREDSFAFRILPPWYRSGWAYGSYLLLLAGALWGTYRAAYRAQQRKLEAQRRVNRQLREVDKLKDEFLANTSHELRTPLYGITGIVESLIDGAAGELTEAAKQNLAMVATSGRRLGHLVGDILDFSKLRHKSLELDRRPVELHALVDVVLTLSGGLIGSKNLQLVNSVAADLPAADADENRLQQILYNLVGNAIKFTEAGRVEVSAALEGDRLVIRVADTGIGIPKDKQEKIFEVFEQGDARVEREYGGTGLGLALTRQLVELHGGALGVESAPGAGSTFSFSLPMAAEAAATTAAATARAAQRHPVRPEPEPPAIEISTALATRVAGESGTSGPRVLVVDDEPVNLQVVRNYLAVEAFDLTLASSGEQALRLLAEEKFDLVLLDVMMPRVSGYEVCRSLRANHSLSDLPVIFLTAKNQDSDVVTGLALGANDYLTKPISKDRLLARVRPHLELLHVHRNLEDLVDEKMAEVTVLEGLLPICAHCKKIRDDENNWRQLEDYIDRHSEASFSHGICPDCFERYVKQSSGTRAPELP